MHAPKPVSPVKEGIPPLKNIDPILQALRTIDDLYSSCHIYDYDWMEQKYGALCR